MCSPEQGAPNIAKQALFTCHKSCRVLELDNKSAARAASPDEHFKPVGSSLEISAHLVNRVQETTGKSLKLTEELGAPSVSWPVLTITVVGDNQLLTTACQRGTSFEVEK